MKVGDPEDGEERYKKMRLVEAFLEYPLEINEYLKDKQIDLPAIN